MSREPGTEAGRRVQRQLEYLSLEPVESIRAKVLAIEAEARQPQPGIDVERLALALRTLYTAKNYLGKRADTDAEAIAREYARLSADGDSPGGAE